LGHCNPFIFLIHKIAITFYLPCMLYTGVMFPLELTLNWYVTKTGNKKCCFCYLTPDKNMYVCIWGKVSNFYKCVFDAICKFRYVLKGFFPDKTTSRLCINVSYICMYVLVVLFSGFQRPGFESTLRLWKWLFF
jgi:hypothetical protein